MPDVRTRYGTVVQQGRAESSLAGNFWVVGWSIFSQTWPPHPSRTTGLVLQRRLHHQPGRPILKPFRGNSLICGLKAVRFGRLLDGFCTGRLLERFRFRSGFCWPSCFLEAWCTTATKPHVFKNILFLWPCRLRLHSKRTYIVLNMCVFVGLGAPSFQTATWPLNTDSK